MIAISNLMQSPFHVILTSLSNSDLFSKTGRRLKGKAMNKKKNLKALIVVILRIALRKTGSTSVHF